MLIFDEKNALKESGRDFKWASDNVEKYFAVATENNYTYDTLTEQAVYDICLGIVSGAKDSLDTIKKKTAAKPKERRFDGFLSDMFSAFNNFCLTLYKQAKKYGLQEIRAGTGNNAHRKHEAANIKISEARQETKDPSVEKWDVDELRSFLNGKKVKSFSCGISDVPDNFMVKGVNAVTKIQGHTGFVLDSPSADLYVDFDSCVSITAHYRGVGAALFSIEIQTGKFGWITLEL